jgi:hypothetical protein
VKLVGLYVVRNEEDLLEVNLRHHFSTAIDAAIAIDNGSTDRTLDVLLRLSEEFPILVASEPGPYQQSEKMTRMARLAAHQGADWVLPIDADEFWTGVESPLREVLAQLPSSVSAVKVDVVNFVQRRDVLVPDATSLLTMTMTPVRRSEGASRILEGQVDNDLIGFVEYIYESKWISRAGPRILIGEGNHYVWNTAGDMPSLSTIACLHAPFRARSVFTPKLDFGRRILEGDGQWSSWHARRWWRLGRQGLMDAEWAANSYADGALDVGGRRRELVEDTRLRETVQPLVPGGGVERPPASRSIDPALGAYLLALDTVPGQLLSVDARLLIELDRQQYLHGIRGDIVDIGAYHGRTASLFGYFVRHRSDRLMVCGLFDKAASTSDETCGEIERHYACSQQEFEAQYLRFHAVLPTIIGNPSAQLDEAAKAQGCRLVHIGTSRGYDAVKRDISIAQRLLAPGGVVIFDDFCEPLNPGAAVAIWEEVLGSRFVPICMTFNKLYGHWSQATTTAPDWSSALEHWLHEEHDIEAVTHRLASRSVIQFSSDDARKTGRSPTESLVIIPSAEDLEVSDAEPAGSNRAVTEIVGGLLGRLTDIPPDRRFFAKLARRPRVVSSHLRAWQALRSSALFDAGYYLGRNPDVAAAGVEPLWHYVQAGESEGRWPNPFFDPSFYRLRMPEVSSSDSNLLQHFFERGGFEGRAPSNEFDPSYYLALHPDVAGSGQNPLSHYLTVGQIEGRSRRLEG